MNIQIIKSDPKAEVSESFLATWVSAVTSELKARKVQNFENLDLELVLVFTDAPSIQNLNATYRKKDAVTDVLSFESEDPECLGELVLCASRIAEQAIEHGLSYEQELGYMILHGVLHLLGYDHENDEAEAAEMLNLQDEVFDRLTEGR